MTDKRPVKTIKTPLSKQSVVMNSYMKGREFEELQKVYLEPMEITGEQEFKVSGSVATEATHKTIELMVVSIDGDKENILDKILDMRREDYEAVINAINETTGSESTVKKTSGSQ